MVKEIKFFLIHPPYFIPIQDPKMYVTTVLNVHRKYHALVLTAFNNDSGFVASLDKVS